MDPLTEAYLIAECKANLSFAFKSTKTTINPPNQPNQPDQALATAVQPLKELSQCMQMSYTDFIHLDFERITFTPRQVTTVLRKLSRQGQQQPIDKMCLWLILHKKIPLYETEDDGNVFSYWHAISLVLKENPFIIKLCWWLTHPQRNWLPGEAVSIVLMYSCGYTDGRREKQFRSFSTKLYSLFYEERERTATVEGLISSLPLDNVHVVSEYLDLIL